MNQGARPFAIVLGARVRADGAPSPTLVRRVLHAITLYNQDAVRQIIVTGGVGLHPPSEAQASATLCLSHGIPETSLVIEDRSLNTFDNLAFSLELVPELSTQGAIIVTDGYHAPRARLVARLLGLSARVSPAPAGPRGLQRLRMILRELVAYPLYWAKYRLKLAQR